MSFVLDLIIVLIAGLTIFFAVKNGFAKTVMSALSFLIALTVALVFRAPAVELLEKTPVPDIVGEKVDALLTDLVENEKDSLSDLISEPGSKLHDLLDTVGIDHSDLPDWLKEQSSGTDDALLSPLSEKLTPKLTTALLNAIVVPVLFLGSWLILWLLTITVTSLSEKVSALKFANKSLGLVIGILLALFRVVLFCVLAQLLLNVANIFGWAWAAGIDPGDTVLFKAITAILLPEQMLK